MGQFRVIGEMRQKRGGIGSGALDTTREAIPPLSFHDDEQSPAIVGNEVYISGYQTNETPGPGLKVTSEMTSH